MKKEGSIVFAGLITALLCESSVSAQVSNRQVTQLVRVGLASGPAGSEFGQALALNGNDLVIGSAGNDSQGQDSGAVFVYEEKDGSIAGPDVLVPRDPWPSSFFGNAVAIDGDRIVVGAKGTSQEGPWTGTAYVFERSGGVWSEQARLIAASQTSWDLFGHAVAISGDTILVSARWKGLGIKHLAGAVFVFERLPSGRYARSRLVGEAVGDMFGESLAIDGDTIAIGAWSADAHGLNSGAVHIFVRQGSEWVQEARVCALDGAPYDHFGASLALAGDLLVVGAEGDDDLQNERGSVYVFERQAGAWNQTAKLGPSDGAQQDLFGTTVAIDSGVIYVGSPAHANPGGGSGAIYRYENHGGQWQETGIKFGEGNLGTALAAGEDRLLSTDARGSGTVRIYESSDPGLPLSDSISGVQFNRGGEHFGTGLAVLGDLVIAGDPGSPSLRPVIQIQSRRSPGLPQQIIQVQFRQRGVGQRIAAHGNVFVTAGDVDAWIYERKGDGWNLVAEIGLLAPQINANLGTAIAVDREQVLVSSPGHVVSSQPNAGVVLSFRKNPAGNWVQAQSITRGIAGERLGRCMALSQDWLFLGTSGSSNKVHVYELQAGVWVQVDSIDGPASAEDFGFDLACEGDVLVVGAPGKDLSTGAAYLYIWDGFSWESRGTLQGSNTSHGDRFGEAIAIHDDSIMIGAPESTPSSNRTGSAYLFAKTGDHQWLEVEHIIPPTNIRARFGAELDMGEGVWAIGANEDGLGGAVYRYDDLAYELSYGTGCPGSAGTPRYLPRAGSQPVLGQTFTADLSKLPPGSPVVAMIGFSRTNWLGLTLPLALEQFAPGCILHSSAEIRVGLSNNAGFAELNLDIPDEPSLEGLKLFTQAVVGETGVNPTGLIFSNALELAIRK
ncbi:MAG: hypothetical protein ACYTG5_18080 [Planctomycetota bacterium]|jgi:hypothetical protein